jgi:hypothetical protein
MPEMKG